MGSKICKYCLDTISTNTEGSSFFVCQKCYQKIKKEKISYCNKIIININKTIDAIDKKIRTVKNKKKEIEYTKLLQKMIRIKAYTNKKILEGKIWVLKIII